jgi:hypothetical protein
MVTPITAISGKVADYFSGKEGTEIATETEAEICPFFQSDS